MVKAVMFDFSGTLLRVEAVDAWLSAVAPHLPSDEVASGAARLHEFGALPGGPSPQVVPAHLTETWATRDLSASHHRAAYTALASAAGFPEAADALYDRSCHPAAWQPYPDTRSTLQALRSHGVPTAVVSNIGWDLRPVFDHHDLTRYIDHFFLSYELGAQKPDPRIFQAACDKLGFPPHQVLMVGDDPHADAGAKALGCPVHLVPHLPTTERPTALQATLSHLTP